MSEELIPYNEEKNSEEERKKFNTILIVIGIILFLILIVLTFGWFFKEDKKKKEQTTFDKRQRLREVETLIRQLEAKKKKIAKTEWFIKLCVRIGIGILIVWGNYCYCKYYGLIPFIFVRDIDKVLNLNAAIVAGYTFIAFITYGSITNFVDRFKEILVKMLGNYHMYSVEELNDLINERDKLKKELDEVDKNSDDNK